ncbi:hypothetical protein G6F62_004788 [Rhizopus arrhizus]|nr:hypothetical protein G6F62_004788 [Rhizopus arrhizus]KAG1372316.1 hypothetical protein G6F61_011165 [Rhizopus arrhizus]
MSVDESLSFRLSKLKTLQKFIKHTPVDMSRLLQDSADVVMKDAAVVENDTRSTEYTKYTSFQREMYVHYAFEKNLKNNAAAKLANVNTYTAHKWKAEYIANPEADASQLNDQHKKQLVDFYDEKPTATIEDGVEELIKIFEGLAIKNSRVAEFMKDECNLSIKSVTRHSAERNSPKTIKARAVWVAEWSAKEIDYYNNCIFIDESGFNLNMTRGKVWSRRDEPAIVASSSTRAISKTALGAVSSSSIINVSVKEPGNLKIRRVAGATKRKPPGDRLNVPKGSTGGHFMQFIAGTMDIMDQFP